MFNNTLTWFQWNILHCAGSNKSLRSIYVRSEIYSNEKRYKYIENNWQEFLELERQKLIIRVYDRFEFTCCVDYKLTDLGVEKLAKRWQHE